MYIESKQILGDGSSIYLKRVVSQDGEILMETQVEYGKFQFSLKRLNEPYIPHIATLPNLLRLLCEHHYDYAKGVALERALEQWQKRDLPSPLQKAETKPELSEQKKKINELLVQDDNPQADLLAAALSHFISLNTLNSFIKPGILSIYTYSSDIKAKLDELMQSMPAEQWAQTSAYEHWPWAFALAKVAQTSSQATTSHANQEEGEDHYYEPAVTCIEDGVISQCNSAGDNLSVDAGELNAASLRAAFQQEIDPQEQTLRALVNDFRRPGYTTLSPVAQELVQQFYSLEFTLHRHAYPPPEPKLKNEWKQDCDFPPHPESPQDDMAASLSATEERAPSASKDSADSRAALNQAIDPALSGFTTLSALYHYHHSLTGDIAEMYMREHGKSYEDVFPWQKIERPVFNPHLNTAAPAAQQDAIKAAQQAAHHAAQQAAHNEAHALGDVGVDTVVAADGVNLGGESGGVLARARGMGAKSKLEEELTTTALEQSLDDYGEPEAYEFALSLHQVPDGFIPAVVPGHCLDVVVPAAGIGSRMGAKVPKQYLGLDEESCVLEHTVYKLLSSPFINHVILALSPEDSYFAQTSLVNEPRVITVIGGADRASSVRAGLTKVTTPYVLVHDAARPLLSLRDLDNLLYSVALGRSAADMSGGILVAPMADTVKQSQKVPALAPEALSKWQELLYEAENVQELSRLELGGLSPAVQSSPADSTSTTKAKRHKQQSGGANDSKANAPKAGKANAIKTGKARHAQVSQVPWSKKPEVTPVTAFKLPDLPPCPLLSPQLQGTLELEFLAQLKCQEAQGTLDRSTMSRAQTPQLFATQVLCAALDFTKEQGLTITDEASAIEACGGKVLLVPGSSFNFKLTEPSDWFTAKALLKEAEMLLQESSPVKESTLASADESVEANADEQAELSADESVEVSADEQAESSANDSLVSSTNEPAAVVGAEESTAPATASATKQTVGGDSPILSASATSPASTTVSSSEAWAQAVENAAAQGAAAVVQAAQESTASTVSAHASTVSAHAPAVPAAAPAAFFLFLSCPFQRIRNRQAKDRQKK